METSLPTPTTARVYVNLPEGKSIHSFFRVSVDGIRFRVKNGTVAWNFCALGRSRRTRKKVNMQQKEKRKRVTQRFKIWWNYMKLYGTKIWQLYTVYNCQILVPYYSYAFCILLHDLKQLQIDQQGATAEVSFKNTLIILTSNCGAKEPWHLLLGWGYELLQRRRDIWFWKDRLDRDTYIEI